MSIRGLVVRLKKLEGQAAQAEVAVWVPPTFDDAYLPALLAELRAHAQLEEGELQGLVAGAWHELEITGSGRRQTRTLRHLHTREAYRLP